MQVSIIIPTYNAEAWLHRAVASALSQEGVSFEVILVDNNSSDGTFALLEGLARQYPDQVTVAREPRQGAAAARNHGLRLARGEWIQFLDADDELLPGKLARQLALASPATDWVVGASIRRATNGTETISVLNPDPWKGLVYNGGLGDTNGNLMRREILLRVGGQDEGLANGEDTDLYFRLLQLGAKTVNDPAPGAVYIDREGFRLSEIKDSASRQRTVRLIATANAYLAAEQPFYFAENALFFRAALLRSIRQLASKNLSEAESRVKEYFPEGIKIKGLDQELLPRFAVLYPIIGFTATEGIRLKLARFLPGALRLKIKGR